MSKVFSINPWKFSRLMWALSPGQKAKNTVFQITVCPNCGVKYPFAVFPITTFCHHFKKHCPFRTVFSKFLRVLSPFLRIHWASAYKGSNTYLISPHAIFLKVCVFPITTFCPEPF